MADTEDSKSAIVELFKLIGSRNQRPCDLCGGNVYLEEDETAHASCRERAEYGLPPQHLGTWCTCCGGSVVHTIEGIDRPIGCSTCSSRGFVNCYGDGDPFTVARFEWFGDCQVRTERPKSVFGPEMRFRSHVEPGSIDDPWYANRWDGDPGKIAPLVKHMAQPNFDHFARTLGDLIILVFKRFSRPGAMIAGYYSGGQPDLPFWEGDQILR